MKGFTLNNETKQRIHSVTGMDAHCISTSDVGEVDSFIERHKKKLFITSINIGDLFMRGSVYLAFRRFINIKDIDSQIDRIKS
ncbi:hypothetical protein EEL51_12770 [Muribaculaceae bacterium Isolate-110 (HZI)]|jgi:hypothetical protein|nr:hypothetical protein EEL51_12770 [Muribaculaceae bacterium Isolate-110 (HZI)]